MSVDYRYIKGHVEKIFEYDVTPETFKDFVKSEHYQEFIYDNVCQPDPPCIEELDEYEVGDDSWTDTVNEVTFIFIKNDVYWISVDNTCWTGDFNAWEENSDLNFEFNAYDGYDESDFVDDIIREFNKQMK